MVEQKSINSKNIDIFDRCIRKMMIFSCAFLVCEQWIIAIFSSFRYRADHWSTVAMIGPQLLQDTDCIELRAHSIMPQMPIVLVDHCR